MTAAKVASNPDIAPRIIEASYETKLFNTAIASEKNDGTDVIDLIMKLRIMVGQSKDVTSQQLEIEARFLKNNYSQLSGKEVELAIELFLNARLGIPLPTHVTFSPLFISHLMNAYIAYRRSTLKEVTENSSRNMMLLSESNVEDRMAGMKDCIVDCHLHSQEGFAERFYNMMVFEFFVRTKRIIPSSYAGSEEYAIKRYEDDQKRHQAETRANKDAKPLMSVLRSNPSVEYIKSVALRHYECDFILIQYFKKNSLKKILDSITTADFK